MNIPVFHDDQFGTAIAALAGVLGGLRLIGKKLDEVKVVVNGVGAAGSAIARGRLGHCQTVSGSGRTG